MPFVEQPIQVTTAPAESDDQIGTEIPGKLNQDANSQTVDLAALYQRNEVLTDPGSPAQVLLTHGLPDAKRTYRPSDSHRVHT